MSGDDFRERWGLELAVFEALKSLPRIPELDYKPDRQHIASNKERVLDPIIQAYQVIVVCGAFFGDEGKGKIVDILTRFADIRMIMRANSGENAGHTVMLDGVEYIFNLAPSGILVPDKVCMIGPECAMDPVNFMEREIAQLVEHGKSYDNLSVGNVYITLPPHKLMDFVRKPANSSTLQGISEVHAAKVRKSGIRLDHIFGGWDVMVRRLGKELRDYQGLLMAMGLSESDVKERCAEMNAGGNKRFPDHVVGFLDAGQSTSQKIDFMIDLYDRVVRNNPEFPKRADTRRILREGLKRGEKALIECAQSFFLGNENEKHWSSSTSASTSAAGTIASSEYNTNRHKTAVINVHKMPSSRVGLGANPVGLVPQSWFSDRGIDTLEKMAGTCLDTRAIEREFFGAVQDNGILAPCTYRDDDSTEYLVGEALAITWAKKFKERGARTKKPRVLGLFDCVAHHHVNDVQGPYLSISAMDRFDDCEKVGVVVAYVYHHPDGKKIDSNGKMYENGQVIGPGDEIPCEQVLQYCRPIIKIMDGWKDAPIAADKWEPGTRFSRGLQHMLATIEHFTGAEVISIGNGSDNKDMIYLRRGYD